MDEGPFRMPRPADRSANNRTAGNRPAEEARPVVNDEPKPARSHVATPHHPHSVKGNKPKRLIAIIIIVVIIVLAVVGGWALWSNKNSGTAIDDSKYQAVFFTNGQVYFGKLHSFSEKYLKLTDVFYLQTKVADAADSKNPQKTAPDSSDVQLIKLGDEIHGPTDEMVISKDQVLFYENLKSDGKVTASIEKFKHPN